MNLIKAIVFLLCSTLLVGQTTPIRNPQIQGASGAIISGATLTNSGTFVNSGTMNGAGTFDLSSGTVTLPATVGGLASWIGVNSITTLGTITTGTWNATPIGVSYGGSGQTSLAASIQAYLDAISTTQGTVLYNNGTDWVALAPGTSGQFLKTQGAGANPAWGSTSLSGLADVAITAAANNDFLVYNGAAWVDADASTSRTALGLGALATLSEVGSAQITDGAIVNADINASAAIAITKLASSAITIAGTSTSLGGSITASTILDSISSTQGTILYRGASGWSALSPGTSGYFLKTQGAGANPMWDAAAGSGSVATDAIWDAAGDLAVGTGANTAARLAIGANGYVLTSNGTTAAWAAASGGAFSTLSDVDLTGIATGDFLKWNGTDWINRTAVNVRTDLGLVIGTNVQAYDADLTTYAGITPSANVQTLLGSADYAAFKTSLSLGSVENTALSTWAGTTNITTLGTITTGTWTGTAIGTGYLASGATLDTEWDTAAEINAATTDADFLTTTAAASAYQPLDADLTTLSSATAAGLALMDDADASAQRTTLGLASAALLGANQIFTDTNIFAVGPTEELVVLAEAQGLRLRDNAVDTNTINLIEVQDEDGNQTLVVDSGGALTAVGGITAASFSGTGSALTGLNASSIASGTVGTARLGTGTANSTTFLRGDGTWATPAGSGTVTATSGTLTASAIMVGNGTTDIKALASLGTTTTVLHGNAAGLPTFGAVSLTADVSGTLPVANGGTGATALTDLITLATHTTGNYVATIADSGASEVTVANSGSENAAVTLALAAGITRDTEWDTLAEVETAMGTINIIAGTEIDTLSEINTIIGDADILPTSGGTMSGNITLGENTSIALDPAGSADGKYSGTTVTGTAGATLAFGDVVVLDVTDSRWELADANSAAAADGDSRALLGICVLAAASDGSATTILLHGIVRADTAFPTFTISAPIYVSETAGDATSTQPTTADVLIRVIGHALTGDEMFFNPDNSWITHL